MEVESSLRYHEIVPLFTDLTPSLVANMGTPLMWAGFLQLVVGNYFLGLFEARLISRKLGKECRVDHMIAANYISMMAGMFVIYNARPIQNLIERDPLRWGPIVMIGMLVFAWVVTVFIEGPFIAKTAELPFGLKSLKLSVRIQTVSYLGLIALSLLLGSVSALTGLRSADPRDVKTVGGWVYYLSTDMKSVHRVRLDGSKSELVAKVEPPKGYWVRVTVEPTSNGDRARLLLRSMTDLVEVDKRVGEASQAAPVERRHEGVAMLGNLTFSIYSNRSFSSVPPVYAGYWAREGIEIGGRRYAFETSLASAVWRSVVVLPDGKVVAQFGHAMMLVDHERGVAAKLAEGIGGDVLIDR